MVTVNVDASGSPQEVQGNTAEANQLGQLIGQAIQEQLIKEKKTWRIINIMATFPSINQPMEQHKLLSKKGL